MNSLPWNLQRKIIEFRPLYSVHVELLDFFEYQLFQIPRGNFRKFYSFCMRNKPFLLCAERYRDPQWAKWIFKKIFNGESPWQFIWFVDDDEDFQESKILIDWLRLCGRERRKLRVYGWSFRYILTRLLNF